MPEKEKKIFSTHGISNFKAFKNLEKIEIAPINLIYGQNSGGKSTFLQSLLALSQSSKSLTNNKFIFSGKEIDAGTFESIKNKTSQKNSAIVVETSSKKEEYKLRNAIRISCFNPILESRNKLFITKSEDTSYGFVDNIEIVFEGYLSGLSLKFNKEKSFGTQSLKDNEFGFIEGRKEYKSRYELEKDSYSNLSEIVLKVIDKASIELKKIQTDFNNAKNEDFVEIDLGFNLRDSKLNFGYKKVVKEKNYVVYQQVINLLKYAAILSGGWIDNDCGVIRYFPYKKSNDKKTQEYVNLLKDYTNDLIKNFIKDISDEKYLFCFFIKKKDDFTLENYNPEKQSLVISYDFIEADFKLILNSDQIIFWDEIQNNIEKLCGLQHANRSKKFVSLSEKLEPLVSEIRDISIDISELRKKLLIISSPNERKYGDHEASEKISKLIKKTSLKKYLDSLKIIKNNLLKIYYKIDKYFNAYDSSYSIYYGFKIVEKSIEKIIYFGDNYESILPGNEEFEAYVENINVNTHVEILQKALYEIYFSSINHIRKYILETIFKPSIIEEDNSKFFYCSFLFLSKITLPKEFSKLKYDNSVNIDEDFFSLNKQKPNYFSRNVIDSYDWELKRAVGDYLKNGFITFANIEFLPFPFFKKNFIAKELTQETVHLGPARPAAKRFYTSKDIEDASYDDAAFLLKETSVTRINISVLNSYLKSINLLDKIRISTSIDKSIVAKKIEVKPLGSKSFVNLADTGYGVSQILPIIINSIFRKEQTIIIQQPETHLHPKLQADIGTLLSNSISSRRSRRIASLKKNWIVETHSEIILLRLLKLIRKGELDSDNLRVYYFDNNDKEGSEIKRMHISKEGELITQWPEGFFSNEMDEVFDI